MTTDLGVIGLTYAGVDLQEDDLSLFLQITKGLHDGYETRGVDVTVPGLDGQLIRPRRFHQRTILLAGMVTGIGATQMDSRASYRSTRSTLASLFDGARVPADLVATLEDLSTATIECRPVGAPLAEEVIVSEHAVISVELLAVSDWVFEAAGS